MKRKESLAAVSVSSVDGKRFGAGKEEGEMSNANEACRKILAVITSKVRITERK